MVLPAEPSETGVSYLTTSKAFLPMELKQPDVERKAQEGSGQREPSIILSSTAICEPHQKCSKEAPGTTQEKRLPSPAFQATTTLPKKNIEIETNTILENVCARSAETRVHVLTNDVNEPVLEQTIIPEEIRSSIILTS